MQNSVHLFVTESERAKHQAEAVKRLEAFNAAEEIAEAEKKRNEKRAALQQALQFPLQLASSAATTDEESTAIN